MGQDCAGIALHDFEVAARKANSVFGGHQQVARLRDQAGAIFHRGRRFLLSHRLIDQNDEGGKFAQPLEPGIFQYQIQILAGGGNARNIPFVGGALAIEERFVQAQQLIAERFEAAAKVGHATIVT